jgi:di/tripeptidase
MTSKPSFRPGSNGGGTHSVDEWVDVRHVGAVKIAIIRVLAEYCDDAD